MSFTVGLKTGHSGIGKSTLINEIQKPIISTNGRFLTGKFELMNKNVAFSAISQAFQTFVRQTLGEDQNILDDIRKRCAQALGAYGQLVSHFHSYRVIDCRFKVAFV